MSFLLIRFCSVAEKILTALEDDGHPILFLYPSTILSYKLIVAVTFIPFFSFSPRRLANDENSDVVTLNSLNNSLLVYFSFENKRETTFPYSLG